MSEQNDLGPFEARLAGLSPLAGKVDRDEIIYQAGQQAARREHRRSIHRWQGACGVLLCLTVGQWLAGSLGDVPSADSPIANQPPAPAANETPSPVEHPLAEPPPTATLPPHGKPAPAVPTWASESLAWGNATSRVAPGPLTAGTPLDNVLVTRPAAPRIANQPSTPPPTLANLWHEWTAPQ